MPPEKSEPLKNRLLLSLILTVTYVAALVVLYEAVSFKSWIAETRVRKEVRLRDNWKADKTRFCECYLNFKIA